MLEFLLWQSAAFRIKKRLQDWVGNSHSSSLQLQTHLGKLIISEGQRLLLLLRVLWVIATAKVKLSHSGSLDAAEFPLFHTRSTPAISITIYLIQMKQYLWLSATFPEKNNSHQESGNLGKICQMCLKHIFVQTWLYFCLKQKAGSIYVHEYLNLSWKEYLLKLP